MVGHFGLHDLVGRTGIDDILLRDFEDLGRGHLIEAAGHTERALDSIITAMLCRCEPDEVIGRVVIDIGDDVVALAFDTIEIARAMEGGADYFMAFETTEVSHTWILISSHAIMAFTTMYTTSGREIMHYFCQFASTGEMEPLFITGYIEVRDGKIGSVVDSLIDRDPSAIGRVGMDNVGVAAVTRELNDDDFLFFIYHNTPPIGGMISPKGGAKLRQIKIANLRILAI